MYLIAKNILPMVLSASGNLYLTEQLCVRAIYTCYKCMTSVLLLLLLVLLLLVILVTLITPKIP